eukprot:gene56876-biopygen118142
MVSFADPVDAVLFGIIVQESLIDAPWPDAPQFGAVNDKWDLQRNSSGDVVWCGIVIRVGIAYGDVKHEINPITHRVDYRGRTVNLASRCESNAPHGAVNLSEECYDAVKDEALEHGRLRDAVFTQLAKVELKGIGFAQMTVITSKKLRGRVHYFRSFHKKENEPATLRDTLHELGLTKYARQLREAGLNTEADVARISSHDDLLPTGVPGFARNKLINRAVELRRIEIVRAADPDRKKRTNIPSRASLSQDRGGEIVPDEHGPQPVVAEQAMKRHRGTKKYATHDRKHLKQQERRKERMKERKRKLISEIESEQLALDDSKSRQKRAGNVPSSVRGTLAKVTEMLERRVTKLSAELVSLNADIKASEMPQPMHISDETALGDDGSVPSSASSDESRDDVLDTHGRPLPLLVEKYRRPLDTKVGLASGMLSQALSSRNGRAQPLPDDKYEQDPRPLLVERLPGNRADGLAEALFRLDLMKYKDALHAENFLTIEDIADVPGIADLPWSIPGITRQILYDHALPVVAGSDEAT